MVSCDERQDREFLLLTQDFYKQFKFSSFVNVKLPVKTKTKIKVSQSSSSSSWWWTEQPTGSYISNFIFLFSKHLKKTVFGWTKWATPFVSLFSNHHHQQSTRRKKFWFCQLLKFSLILSLDRVWITFNGWERVKSVWLSAAGLYCPSVAWDCTTVIR